MGLNDFSRRSRSSQQQHQQLFAQNEPKARVAQAVANYFQPYKTIEYAGSLQDETGGANENSQVEMEQRQRIFEEVIIQRIKIVQDFVKTKFEKLNKKIDTLKKTQKAGISLEAALGDKGEVQTTSNNPLIKALEESLKWKVEAESRKQGEVIAQIEERLSQNKRVFESMTDQY